MRRASARPPALPADRLPVGLGEKWLEVRLQAHRARVRLVAHRRRAETHPRYDTQVLAEVAAGEVRRAEEVLVRVEAAMERSTESRWDLFGSTVAIVRVG